MDIKAEKILKSLKSSIKRNGYIENLGQDQLSDYRAYAFNLYRYSEAAARYTELNTAIEAL